MVKERERTGKVLVYGLVPWRVEFMKQVFPKLRKPVLLKKSKTLKERKKRERPWEHEAIAESGTAGGERI